MSGACRGVELRGYISCGEVPFFGGGGVVVFCFFGGTLSDLAGRKKLLKAYVLGVLFVQAPRVVGSVTGLYLEGPWFGVVLTRLHARFVYCPESRRP